MSAPPLLYTFRRCPYAIRARMAIAASGVQVVEHEVALSAKPAAMLAASPKGTVPVLVLPEGQVIDESLDIMHWALGQRDPANWLGELEDSLALILRNDREFKPLLDAYKYPERHRIDSTPADPARHRDAASQYLLDLQSHVAPHDFLLGRQPRLADVAIMPFIRQFAAVDPAWWSTHPYPALSRWLNRWLEDPVFASVMAKRTETG